MITDKFSIKNTPHKIGINNSLRIAIANTAMIPPNAKLPVSPINTCAGKAVVPKETNTCSNKGCHKYHQLTSIWYVHDV
jgi:hypothetical protein